MIITVIAEPRSGSTNFANWFYFKENFTVLFEPTTNSKLKWYKGNLPLPSWNYNTEHLLIKEVLSEGLNFNKLIAASDKIILLYRENEEEQLDSWLNATVKGNWDKQWVYKGIKNEKEELSFREMKKAFKEQYLSKDFFRVSYEEVYYGNDFGKVLEYLNIEGLENKLY